MKKVLLALGRYDPPIHAGIAAYASEHDWHLNAEMVRRMGRVRAKWTADGMIVNSVDEQGLKAKVGAKHCQIVHVQGRRYGAGEPFVMSDQLKTAALAFDFFRSKGFRHFASYGVQGLQRLESFRIKAESEGFICHRLDRRLDNLDDEAERIAQWLKGCPKPTAVFCNNDDEGARLINLAIEKGSKIPEDIAVLGTDNTELACTSCRVHLSSIDTDLFSVGYEAARILDLLMHGNEPDQREILIDPKGVVERESTDTIGVTSPHVRRAIALMEADFRNGISVADVVAEVGISHTGLVKAFRRELDYSPKDALRNIRMREAAQLLATTSEKIRTIGHLVGMNSEQHFYAAFKRFYGKTPRQYRLGANSE